MIEFIVKYWLEVLFGGLLALLGWLYKRLNSKMQEARQTDQAIADGMKYLLMYRLREEGQRHLEEKHCTLEDKAEFERVYKAYHALGGNDTITALKKQIMDLPV